MMTCFINKIVEKEKMIHIDSQVKIQRCKRYAVNQSYDGNLITDNKSVIRWMRKIRAMCKRDDCCR